MKITINTPNECDPLEEVVINLPDNYTANDMAIAFKTVLYALTYQPETINKFIKTYDR